MDFLVSYEMKLVLHFIIYMHVCKLTYIYSSKWKEKRENNNERVKGSEKVIEGSKN